MGSAVRQVSRFFGWKDSEKLLKLLYRNIGIALSGHCPGCMKMESCYFSQYYTPEMCWFISAMDQGMMSGL